MSSEDELSNELSRNDVEDLSEDEEEQVQRTKDDNLMEAVYLHDTAGVQQALRNGANVNCFSEEYFATPLISACREGYDEIVRILLDAGADARSNNRAGCWAIHHACSAGHLSVVEMLLNHDNGLLEIEDGDGWTPLLASICSRQYGVVNLLLDRGANALAIHDDGSTTLILACEQGADLEIVRRLLAAGVGVQARNYRHCTALHLAAMGDNTALVRELIVEHNANIFVVNTDGYTPFDLATYSDSAAGRVHAFLMESYSTTVNQEHGRLALHAVLGVAEYSFAQAYRFHPPQNPLRIRLPLGELTLLHFRTLLSTLDPELIRDRDATGKLPIHIACQNKAPVDVLDLILKQDAATLHITDYTGALPIHVCCHGAVDYSSVLFLVEHGGVSTLAACNHHGALPLHLLCESTNPSLRIVQYLIQSFRGSVAARTNAGHYPFMIAACESSTASLSVVYELVRTNPDLVVPY